MNSPFNVAPTTAAATTSTTADNPLSRFFRYACEQIPQDERDDRGQINPPPLYITQRVEPAPAVIFSRLPASPEATVTGHSTAWGKQKRLSVRFYAGLPEDLQNRVKKIANIFSSENQMDPIHEQAVAIKMGSI